MKNNCALLLTILAAVMYFAEVASKDQKADKKDVPRVVVAAPLGVPPGAKTKLTIRGLKLDTASEIRFFEPKVIARILKKEKTPVGNQQDPNRIGDSLVEIELTLPEDMVLPDLGFVVVTPAG